MNNARSMNNYATSIAAYRARVIAHDVPQTHPFFTEIMWVIGNGISTGYGDGTYRPYDSVNRDAMAAFLYRFAGSPAYTPPAVSPFLDVPTTNMYYKEITWLASKGISTGYVVAGGKEFRPLQPVNRDAMAAFLYRYAGSPAYTPPAVSPFSDVPTSDLYYKEITWLNSTGITTGYSDGTYRRLTPVAREAMAVFMYRYRHTIG